MAASLVAGERAVRAARDEHRIAGIVAQRNAAAAELDDALDAARDNHIVERMRQAASDRCRWLDQINDVLAKHAMWAGRSYVAPFAGRICRQGPEIEV